MRRRTRVVAGFPQPAVAALLYAEKQQFHSIAKIVLLHW